LTLRLKAADHLPAIHAQFDNLESDAACHRLPLLSHIDDAKATFTDLFQELVTSHGVARTFRNWCFPGFRTTEGLFEKRRVLFVKFKELLHTVAKGRVFAAHAGQVRRALVRS
jgi:hypothetical protein